MIGLPPEWSSVIKCLFPYPTHTRCPGCLPIVLFPALLNHRLPLASILNILICYLKIILSPNSQKVPGKFHPLVLKRLRLPCTSEPVQATTPFMKIIVRGIGSARSRSKERFVKVRPAPPLGDLSVQTTLAPLHCHRTVPQNSRFVRSSGSATATPPLTILRSKTVNGHHIHQ